MKVFWFAKFTGENPLPLYRSFLESGNLYSENVEEPLPFSYVTINNPITSNLVYILNTLYLNSHECSALKLFMTDDVNYASNNINNNLEIKHLNDNINISDMIELPITCTSNLLTNHYVIIIPGGSLIIKTNKPILSAKLCMNYTTQEL